MTATILTFPNKKLDDLIESEKEVWEHYQHCKITQNYMYSKWLSINEQIDAIRLGR